MTEIETKYIPEVKTARVKRTGEVVKVVLNRYTSNPYYVVGSASMEHYWWDELEFINK